MAAPTIRVVALALTLALQGALPGAAGARQGAAEGPHPPGAVTGTDESPAAEPDPATAREPAPAPGPTLLGRLTWLSAGGIDWVGDLGADVPFASRGAHDAWFRADLRTTIEDATSDLDFEVRDVSYAFDVGWRFRRTARGPGAIRVFAGQRGIEPVDAAGGAAVRYVAAGLESRSFLAPRPEDARGPELQWRFALGPVLSEKRIDADLWGRAEARLRQPVGPRAAFVLDLRVEGVAGDGLDADVTGGPGYELTLDDGRRALFFLHYQDAESPFGIGEDAWWAGLQYTRDPSAPPEHRGDLGQLSGSVTWGAGDENRGAAQLALRLASPRFGRRLRVALDVDANALVSDTLDEIYWRYELGVEHVPRRSTFGMYLYHRSNHRLATPATGSTGINVIELGCRSRAWGRPGLRPHRRRPGSFDYLFRVGWIVNSSFGEDERVRFRAGARWALPLAPAGLVPFVRFELEEGDIAVRSWAFGVTAADDLDLQVEYRDDEQYTAPDKTALLLTASYGF